jgi:transcriptional activator of cad operon
MCYHRAFPFSFWALFMQQPVVRVGEWLVTPSVNQISRKGRQLTLEPRLIDLLVFFARHPGEVLSRDELIDNVWTRNVVTSHVVTQSISELRKSLKDGNDSSPNILRRYQSAAISLRCRSSGVRKRGRTGDGDPVRAPRCNA